MINKILSIFKNFTSWLSTVGLIKLKTLDNTALLENEVAKKLNNQKQKNVKAIEKAIHKGDMSDVRKSVSE